MNTILHPTTVSILSPAHVPTPRAAVWAANAFVAVTRAIDRLTETRRAVGRQREAAEVRKLARDMDGIDPRFAADLRAAADRHEAGR